LLGGFYCNPVRVELDNFFKSLRKGFFDLFRLPLDKVTGRVKTLCPESLLLRWQVGDKSGDSSHRVS